MQNTLKIYKVNPKLPKLRQTKKTIREHCPYRLFFTNKVYFPNPSHRHNRREKPVSFGISTFGEDFGSSTTATTSSDLSPACFSAIVSGTSITFGFSKSGKSSRRAQNLSSRASSSSFWKKRRPSSAATSSFPS